MKYMFTIFGLVLMTSLLTLYYLWPDSGGASKPSTEQNGQESPASYHLIGQKAREAASLNRQILVQEAQRIGIDKEESFRKSLKEYYEQSLVRVLMDRKLAETSVTVSEEDIDSYLGKFGSIFTFTRFPVINGKIQQESGNQSTVLFDELSSTLQLLLAGLELGESASQYETGTEISVIRLDAVRPSSVVVATDLDRNQIREQLANYKRSQQIDLWIHMLRESSH